jgi:hypothetical protein
MLFVPDLHWAGEPEERLDELVIRCACARALAGPLTADAARAALATLGMELRGSQRGYRGWTWEVQHLDHAAEALNTTFHRLQVRLNATSPHHPQHARYAAQTELVRAARMAVIAAREAGRKVGPVDYRVDEILY